MILSMALAAVLSLLPVAPQATPVPVSEPVATFSIVAYDPETGDLGVAVQSRFFAVGAVVPWAKAGVGAIATQSYANTSYGPKALELLASGKSPAEVMEMLTEGDPGKAQRQVGIVDAKGRSATFTGAECLAWAGGVADGHFAAQGNILTGEAVATEMARVFKETKGLLGDRLLAALDAGQAAGGDSRGMQSAALLIVREKGGYGGFNDRWCDLRVDDAPNPFVELRRLYTMWKPNALILEGYKAAETGDFEQAYAYGREALAIDAASGDPQYHLGCYHAKAGKHAEALDWLKEAVAKDKAHGDNAKRDTDYKPLWDTPEFKAIVGS
jgi:uncharacterized Ntn-hydrolase superfamily protein